MVAQHAPGANHGRLGGPADPRGRAAIRRTLRRRADGALWFSLPPWHIARLDTDSLAMTTLRCDGPLPGPTGMTVGADGAVWFSTLLGGYLGRIDPGNLRIERIDLPHGWAGGLMWATLSLGRFGNGQLIGIDPDDMTVAESFALGFGSFPCGLTRAPDGALWLGEPVRGNVARIDPLAGEVRRYPVRALGGRLRTALGSFPTYLNTRPDHAIWITQHLVPWIARIDA